MSEARDSGLRRLVAVSAALLEGGDPPALARKLFDLLGPHVGADLFFHFRYEPDVERPLVQVACAGVDDEDRAAYAALRLGEDVCGLTAAERAPRHVANVQHDDAPYVARLRAAGVRAYMCMPLLVRERLLGTFSFGSRHRDRFEPADLDLVGTACHQFATALDRWQTERALHAGEERLRFALEAADTGIWTWDLRSGAVTWSPECFRILGIAREDFTGTAHAFLSRVHPDDRTKVRATVEGALGTRSLYECELRFLRPDGQTVWLNDRGRATYEPGGKPIAMVGTITDITARKRAEVDRGASEALYRALAAHLPGGAAFVVDHELRYRLADGEALRSAGFAPSDLEGKTLAEAVPSDLLAQYEAQYRQALAGHAFRTEHERGGRHFVTHGVPLFAADGTVNAALAISYDLTDRVQAERDLRESESFHRQTLESIPGMVFTSTPDGSYDYVSEHWVEYTGAPARELQGTGWVNLLHPDDRERAQAAWRAAVEGRAPYDLEYRVRGKDGRYEWFKVRGRAICDDEGKIRRWFGTAVNVDDLKRAQAEIADRELRYRLVADAANDVIWDWDLVTNRVVWNEGVRRFFGHDLGDLLTDGAWWMERIHPDDRQRVVRDVSAHINGGRPVWSGEYRFRKGDGTYALVLDRARIVRDAVGKPLRMVGSVLDLTEKRKAEAALRAAEERFAFVRRSSGVGFWYCDLPFDVLTWDEHVKAHFHLPPDAAVTIDTFYERIHPDDREPTRQAIEASIAGHTPYDVTYRTVHPDTGAERWIRAIGRTTYDDETGAPRRFDGITVDVTEHKRVEGELRGRERELREQDRRKDEFLATLAHELRNPLAPLRTGLEVLELTGGTGRAAERARSMMSRQLEHMVRLIDDLMDVSRISRGKVELRQERLTVRTIIDHAIETSRPLIEASKHRLSVTVPDEPLWVVGDLTRLAQVVSNVLNNAAKYTPSGGHIAVEASARSGEVILRITDDGVGIPADMLPRVFDLFAQASRTRDRAQGGLGIGLSLARKLVEMQGGSITAESAGVGRGSTFSMRLPLAQSAVADVGAGAAPSARERPGGRRVLVVDDNVDGAESLALLLELSGHETTVAHDAAAALDAARSLLPEVVFLDIGLPGMDGYEVARRLRGDPATSRAMLVAVTGWGSEADKRKSRDAGFDHHLTKPVDGDAVGRLLERPV